MLAQELGSITRLFFFVKVGVWAHKICTMYFFWTLLGYSCQSLYYVKM